MNKFVPVLGVIVALLGIIAYGSFFTVLMRFTARYRPIEWR